MSEIEKRETINGVEGISVYVRDDARFTPLTEEMRMKEILEQNGVDKDILSGVLSQMRDDELIDW